MSLLGGAEDKKGVMGGQTDPQQKHWIFCPKPAAQQSFADHAFWSLRSTSPIHWTTGCSNMSSDI